LILGQYVSCNSFVPATNFESFLTCLHRYFVEEEEKKRNIAEEEDTENGVD